MFEVFLPIHLCLWKSLLQFSMVSAGIQCRTKKVVVGWGRMDEHSSVGCGRMTESSNWLLHTQTTIHDRTTTSVLSWSVYF